MPNWKKIIISGSDAVLTSVIATAGFTGSLLGTASFASTASFITASGVYGPYGSNSVISASYALNALSASYAVTSSYGLNPTISGSINNVNYIDFNTGSATPAWKSGRVFWDNTDGCLAVYNAEQDITLQVGQENWTRVSNRTGTTITNGTAVRIIGAHGDVPEIERAQSIAVSGSVNLLNQILGIATHDIEDNSIGYVTTQGLVRGLNTNAFNDGDTLFVGTGSSGVLQNTAPRAPFEIIPIGVCVKASPGTSGIIYVAVQEPIDFSDLSSVLVSGSYNYGDLWTYVQSGSFGVWTHTNRLSGSYSVTGSWSATSFTGSLQGTSSWASNAITASYVLNAVSSSFSSTASFATSASFAISSSRAISSSFATSASFASTVPASGVIGLNLSQIATASFTASVSPTQFTVTSASITEFTVTGTGVTIGNTITDTHRVTGSLNISGSTNINGDVQLTGSMFSTGSRFTFRTTGTVDAVTITGSTGAYGNSLVSINAMNQTNQNGLRIFNLGVGDSGMVIASSAGGDGVQFTPNQIAQTNRNFTFSTNNNAYDSSTVAFTFRDFNKPTLHYKSFLILGSTTTFKSGSYFEVQKSGSIPILHLAGDAQSGSFSPNELYISGSLRVNSGNSVITGSLTVVSGNARELQVTAAGVNIGNIITDTHTVTGSFNISGSTNINGNAQITGSLAVTQNITGSRMFLSSSNGTASGSTLTIYGSGSAQPVFTVQGSQGELFSITDSLSGSLFSVNDISGLPILEVFSNGTTLIGNYADPMLITTTYNRGPSGPVTIYSLPTSSYDTAFFDYSVRSGSNARAGQIMAIQNGSTVNYTETTTVDFGSTSGVSLGVFVSGSNMVLTGSTPTSGWIIKTIVRGI
jgi:hypothetical protein